MKWLQKDIAGGQAAQPGLSQQVSSLVGEGRPVSPRVEEGWMGGLTTWRLKLTKLALVLDSNYIDLEHVEERAVQRGICME